MKALEMPREKRDDVSVKIAAQVYKKGKQVAAYRSIPLAQYLSELLEKPVNRDYAKMHEEMGEEMGDDNAHS